MSEKNKIYITIQLQLTRGLNLMKVSNSNHIYSLRRKEMVSSPHNFWSVHWVKLESKYFYNDIKNGRESAPPNPPKVTGSVNYKV